MKSHLFRLDHISFFLALLFCTLALSGLAILLYAGVTCLWIALVADLLEGEDKK